MLFLWIVLGVWVVCWLFTMMLAIVGKEFWGERLGLIIIVSVIFMFISPFHLFNVFIIDKFRKEKQYVSLKEIFSGRSV